MRQLKYSEAIAEATVQAMEANPRLFLMGEGIDDTKGAFGTTLPALEKFGKGRVLDMPLSECAMTGIGIGAAVAGHPCLMIHMRCEFLLLAMDQIVNHAAKWRYMFDDRFRVPIVMRAIVGRGWGQAAQHSQSFHGMWAAVPGLKVILPTTPYDAKGMLIEALQDPDPVVCIEHRWLFDRTGHVPEEPYRVPLDKARIVAEGEDATCVAFSYSVLDAMAARSELAKEGIDLEVIDARSARPLDTDAILRSLKKTGHLVVCDIAGAFCGISAEVAALACGPGFSFLKAPVARITLPDAPTPCSSKLESAYYPTPEHITRAVRASLRREGPSQGLLPVEEGLFSGPF